MGLDSGPTARAVPARTGATNVRDSGTASFKQPKGLTPLQDKRERRPVSVTIGVRVVGYGPEPNFVI